MTFVKSGFVSYCLLPLLSLLGCTPGQISFTKGIGVERSRASYADEPYQIQRVNRLKFEERLRPAIVQSPYPDPPGTIIIDTKSKQLYLTEQGGLSRRYGVAVGATGYAWTGQAVIGRKVRWPSWYPTDDMRSKLKNLPTTIAPGPTNPLGARGLYLYRNGIDTLYRIHGTSEPWTIGTEASSGCIRMTNEDVIDLFERVSIGANVIVR